MTLRISYNPLMNTTKVKTQISIMKFYRILAWVALGVVIFLQLFEDVTGLVGFCDGPGCADRSLTEIYLYQLLYTAAMAVLVWLFDRWLARLMRQKRQSLRA
jgi:hypothetical protein